MSDPPSENRRSRTRTRSVAAALTGLVVTALTGVAAAPAYATSHGQSTVTAAQVAVVAAAHKNAQCRAATGKAPAEVQCISTRHTTDADKQRLQQARSAKPAGARARTRAAARADAINPPTQCVQTPWSDPGAWFGAPDRKTACAEIFWEIDEYQVVDGADEQVGTLEFDSQQWASYSTVAADPSWIHGSILTVYFADGDLADELVEINSYCSIIVSQCRMNTGLLPDPQEFEMLTGEQWSNEWSETDLGVRSSNASFLEGEIAVALGFRFETIVDDGTSYDSYPQFGTDVGPGYNGLHGRCDVIVSSRASCVNDQYVPTVNFDSIAYPAVAPVAQHVYDAQRSIVPEHFGVPLGTAIMPQQGGEVWPLTRDTNAADITANRNASCANVQPPLGYNCDEYPMASTYEGAAFQPHFSVTTVPVSANNSQGGILSYFYLSNRVLDGDIYFVQARLPDGRLSWVHTPLFSSQPVSAHARSATRARPKAS
jgi:Deoxyribonuclease NucA/NucB